MPLFGRRTTVADAHSAGVPKVLIETVESSSERSGDGEPTSAHSAAPKTQEEKPFVPYKKKYSKAIRMEQTAAIKRKFPHKIPVIVERFRKEKDLPQLEKSKFLVPKLMTMPQLLWIIKSRLRVSESASVYVLIANRGMASMNVCLGEVYDGARDEDGFLYVTYASQEIFG